MKRVLSLALAAALVVPFIAQAQAKPDFSGTWTLDAAKSDPAPAGRGGRGGGGGAAGPVTIKQSATEITIGMNTYKLDGSETEIQGRGGVQKAKATWDGAKLVITTNIDARGAAITTKAVRSLSTDGKEMTVENTVTGMPQGGGTTKQVYTKQ